METIQGGGWAGCIGGLLSVFFAGVASVGSGGLGIGLGIAAGLSAYDACTN